ncbi:MAG: glycosyltransferase family 61 protein [Hespellia sp.]|nr:glycosyltransferase family 61 protein [Hespellia sp.]
MQLDVTEVKNGVILPAKYMSVVFPCGVGGVVDEEGAFMEESISTFPERFGGAYDYPKSEEVNLDEDILYIGYLRTHWGHFLADCTLRMWYLMEEDIHCKVAYCGSLHEENILPESIKAFFDILGIKREQLVDIRVPTRARRIFIPQISLDSSCHYTSKFKDMFRGMSKKVNADLFETNEKLYFTRTRLANEKEIGEELVEEIFRKNGYKIISPEYESLEKQIALMKSCKTFASMEGTVAHNIVFAEEGTKQIILRKHTYMNLRQPYLNQCMGVNATYIDIGCRPFGKHFPRDFYGGIFWVRATKELRNYCKDNHMWFPTYRKILWMDLKCAVKYLYQCGKHIKRNLRMQYQIAKEDRVILKRIYNYKNIVIYGVNERAFRWKRKIQKRYSAQVFLTDTNWKAIQKYEKVCDWEGLNLLDQCCFLISIKNAEASIEVKNALMKRGIYEKDIYYYAST